MESSDPSLIALMNLVLATVLGYFQNRTIRKLEQVKVKTSETQEALEDIQKALGGVAMGMSELGVVARTSSSDSARYIVNAIQDLQRATTSRDPGPPPASLT